MTTAQIVLLGVGAYLVATAPFDKRFASAMVKCLLGIITVVAVLRATA